MNIIAMVPVRMGSQRLKQKNLREIAGMPLVTHAIRKCINAGVFDEIWVNSEHPLFGEIAAQEGVNFHQRSEELANNQATSEEYTYDFLTSHNCDYLFQVHGIAPLLSVTQVTDFVKAMLDNNYDTQLSAVNEQIECAMNGKPVNFSFDRKTNSQELIPIQRITWSITGWKTSTFLDTFESGQCATYSGQIGIYAIDRLAGHIIKTEEDLQIAEALYLLRTEHDNGAVNG